MENQLNSKTDGANQTVPETQNEQHIISENRDIFFRSHILENLCNLYDLGNTDYVQQINMGRVEDVKEVFHISSFFAIV